MDTSTPEQDAVFDLAKEFLQSPSTERDAELIASAKEAFGSKLAKKLFSSPPPDDSDEGNKNEEEGNPLVKHQLGCANGCHCSTQSNWCADDLPCIYNPADSLSPAVMCMLMAVGPGMYTNVMGDAELARANKFGVL